MEIFAKRLKQLRQEKQLSLDMVEYDISQKFNIKITKSHLSRWESGKVTPSVINAGYLARYYDVSMDYLMGFTDCRIPVNLLVKTRKA